MFRPPAEAVANDRSCVRKRSGFRTRTTHNYGYIPNVGEARPASARCLKIKKNEFRRNCPEAHSQCSLPREVRTRGTRLRQRRERRPRAGREIGALPRRSGSRGSPVSAKRKRSRGGDSPARPGRGSAGGDRRTSAFLDGVQIIVTKRFVKLFGEPVNSCAHRGRSFQRIPSRILRAKSAFSEPGASSIVL